ncbi:MAG: hypothetical protein WC332_00540, partial [Clostridia bacterium]
MPDIYVKDYDTTVSFPDNTSPDVMKAALSKKFPKKEGFIDKAKGVGEAVLTTGLGAVNWIPGGIIKASGAVSGQLPEATELADTVQEKLSYQPKTETGKKLAGYVSYPFEKISEGSQKAADWTYDTTGSPLLATAVRTAGESIPFVAAPIVGKGIKGIKGKITPPEMGDIIPEKQGVPTSLLPEIDRAQRVHPDYVRNAFDKQDLLSLPEGKLPTNAGEGFTFSEPKPQTILRKGQNWTEGQVNPDLQVEYTPTISKSGKPFKTEKSADLSATQNGLKGGEFEVIPVQDGFGYRKIRDGKFEDQIRRAAIKAQTRDEAVVGNEEGIVQSNLEQYVEKPIEQVKAPETVAPKVTPKVETVSGENTIPYTETLEGKQTLVGLQEHLRENSAGEGVSVTDYGGLTGSGVHYTTYEPWVGEICKKFNTTAKEIDTVIDKYLTTGGVREITKKGEWSKSNMTDRQWDIFNAVRKVADKKGREVNSRVEELLDKENKKNDLIEKGYEPSESVEAYNLNKGDEVIKDGENYKVIDEN